MLSSSSSLVQKSPSTMELQQQGGNTSLRVASFSCYLDTPPKDKFLHKISAQNYPPKDANLSPFTFPQQPPPEITLLGAQQYFTMKLMGPTKPDRGPGPAALRRNGSQKKRLLFFPRFGCKGPCFNRKDVIHTKKETPSFCGSTRAKSERIIHRDVVNMEESRKSIEVFGSGTSVLRGGDIAKNLERKLSMLTWDAIPKAKNLPTSTVGSFCDDVASEASSDLFEIDNIISAGSVLRDDVSMTMSPSSHYAPSEASIQWSVVTADYYPPNSDYNEQGVDLIVSTTNQNKKGGGILGCNTVDVVETRVSRKTNLNAKEFAFSNSQATHRALNIRS